MDHSDFTANCYEESLLWSWDKSLFYWILVTHKIVGFYGKWTRCVGVLVSRHDLSNDGLCDFL